VQTIPEVKQRTAEVIVAETGADMTRLPPRRTWRHGRVCPGHHAFAGKPYLGRTRPGQVWLADALIEAA
jgi:transposase